jgi:hypothetical protein
MMSYLISNQERIDYINEKKHSMELKDKIEKIIEKVIFEEKIENSL